MDPHRGCAVYIAGGSPVAEFFRLTYSQLSEAILETMNVTPEEFEAYLELHNDPCFAWRAPLTVATAGQR